MFIKKSDKVHEEILTLYPYLSGNIFAIQNSITALSNLSGNFGQTAISEGKVTQLEQKCDLN